MSLVSLYTPWKHQKARGFLMFSGDQRCVKIVCIRRDTEYLTVFSPNAGKYGPEKLRIQTLSSSAVAWNGLMGYSIFWTGCKIGWNWVCPVFIHGFAICYWLPSMRTGICPWLDMIRYHFSFWAFWLTFKQKLFLEANMVSRVHLDLHLWVNRKCI